VAVTSRNPDSPDYPEFCSELVSHCPDYPDCRLFCIARSGLSEGLPAEAS